MQSVRSIPFVGAAADVTAERPWVIIKQTLLVATLILYGLYRRVVKSELSLG